MLKLATAPGQKLDLSSTKVLIVAKEINEQDILAQMLMGFGVQSIRRSDTYEEALASISKEFYDIAVIEVGPRQSEAYDLMLQARRHKEKSISQIPVIMIRGHIRSKDVFKARDCGANLVLTKPISSRALFDHILWLAQDHRSFVDCDSYIGPDRRFKASGPPAGTQGRRKDDLSADVGEATEANLSQDAVDSFFGAKKAGV
jgi:DNA-binding response OmpR family regulator